MATIIPVSKDFLNRLSEFIITLGKYLDSGKISYEMGTKYAKIIIGNFSNSIVYCFIDFSGNIYKSASNGAVQAKQIHGSIYDDDFSIGKTLDHNGVI